MTKAKSYQENAKYCNSAFENEMPCCKPNEAGYAGLRSLHCILYRKTATVMLRIEHVH